MPTDDLTEATMTRSQRRLPLGYRVGWSLRLAAVTVFGPAELDGAADPKTRLRRERAAREAALVAPPPRG